MDERPRDHLDPTKVRDQPALRSSSGRVWIVAGGLLLLVTAAVLAWIVLSGGSGAVPVAVTTAGLAAALYVVLLVVRFAVRPGKLRLRIMAAAMIGMALVAIVGLLVSVWVESISVR